jgi:hypothetical protein
MVSTPAARKIPASGVPWKALARFLSKVCSPSTGAMRESIAHTSVSVIATTSIGILQCHKPISVKGASRSVIS